MTDIAVGTEVIVTHNQHIQRSRPLGWYSGWQSLTKRGTIVGVENNPSFGPTPIYQISFDGVCWWVYSDEITLEDGPW